MANRRYIEIDSSYRDRVKNPSPADFTLELAQTGNKDKFNAVDPISTAAPTLIFTGNFDLSGGDTVSGTVTAITPGIGAAGDNVNVSVSMTAGEMQQIKNWYVGSVLRDTTISENRRIIESKYINTTGGLDRGIFTVLSAYGNTFAVGDAVTIINPSDNSLPNSVIFIPQGNIFAENFYINKLLYDTTIDEVRTITNYNAILSLATLDSPFGGGWANTDSYLIRTTVPIGTGTLTGSTINTFDLPATFSNVFNVYTGDFIRIISGPALGDIRRITSYSNATTPSLTGSVHPSFSAIPGAADFELLQFTRDNYVPINYTGNIVSQQELVCYEIQLVNLILPNEILNTGLGGRITYYPFVYVELSNVSSPGGQVKSIIYSNNPNSTRALFRVAVKDVPNPVLSNFVRLDANNMTQTVKFKPNDALHFKVTLPSGELFETVLNERFSPFLPNPLMQISALFSIKREVF